MKFGGQCKENCAEGLEICLRTAGMLLKYLFCYCFPDQIIIRHPPCGRGCLYDNDHVFLREYMDALPAVAAAGVPVIAQTEQVAVVFIDGIYENQRESRYCNFFAA